MRREGCKDGCFCTTVSSGTFAKAVCSSLSQRQHGLRCQGKPCGCDCPSQLWKILFSKFLTLKIIENFANVRLLNVMRNSGGLKTGVKQDAWKFWGLKPLSKQSGSGFAEILSGNSRSCPESWTYRPNQCRASSGTIYTWERTPAQRGASLLVLWRRSDGQEQSASSSGTQRTGTKTSRTTRFMLKLLVRWWKMFRGCREAITLPTSRFGGRYPFRGCHAFIYARKGWNWRPRVSRGRATWSCETS